MLGEIRSRGKARRKTKLLALAAGVGAGAAGVLYLLYLGQRERLARLEGEHRRLEARVHQARSALHQARIEIERSAKDEAEARALVAGLELALAGLPDVY